MRVEVFGTGLVLLLEWISISVPSLPEASESVKIFGFGIYYKVKWIQLNLFESQPCKKCKIKNNDKEENNFCKVQLKFSESWS